jgi:hypothetical protein
MRPNTCGRPGCGQNGHDPTSVFRAKEKTLGA